MIPSSGLCLINQSYSDQTEKASIVLLSHKTSFADSMRKEGAQGY
jgi:hypothetical protein